MSAIVGNQNDLVSQISLKSVGKKTVEIFLEMTEFTQFIAVSIEVWSRKYYSNSIGPTNVEIFLSVHCCLPCSAFYLCDATLVFSV